MVPFAVFVSICEMTGGGGANVSPALTKGIGLKIGLAVVLVDGDS